MTTYATWMSKAMLLLGIHVIKSPFAKRLFLSRRRCLDLP